MSETIARILIEDEVNIHITGADLNTRRKLVNAVKFFLPHARYSPAFKLGRWDGTTSFCTLGGKTYLNMLDKLLPILVEHGYEIVIDDQRVSHEFDFAEIDENYLSSIVWPPGHRAAGQPITLRDYQVDLINTCLTNMQGIIIAPTSAGKCQPMSSLVKIPGGWKTIADISIGDVVTIPSGESANVIGVYDPGVKDVYKITFEDGRVAMSCKDHIWKVHNHNWTNKWKLLSLEDIIKYQTTTTRKMSIPLPTMDLDSHDVILPMPPYLLGALLGDGSFRNGIGMSSIDQELIDKLSGLITDEYVIKKKSGDNCDYSIVFKSPEIHRKHRSAWVSNKGGIILNDGMTYHYYNQCMRTLGLDGTHSYTKFVPTEYLNAGYTQRLHLLQGLLDTDGYVSAKGTIEFSSTSQQLAKDVATLVRSVGGIAKMRCDKNRQYRYKGEMIPCRDCYTLSIYHATPEILLSLSRKVSRITNRVVRKLPILHINNIELVSCESVRCIMIDHPDHLYITNDYIVTHNTIVTASLSRLVQDLGRSVVIVPNKNLVQQTEEDYRNVGLDVGVLYGDRKEYNRKHTICTWQSLNVLDKKSKDALDDDQLAEFLSGLVAVIVDEVHAVKDLGVLHRLLSTTFANIPIRWGMTGTVPEAEYNQMSLYSVIGPLVGELEAKDLQDAGHLAQCNVNCLQTQETQVYKDYQSELKFLLNNTDRLTWMAQRIQEIALTGNTLVLIDRIATGKALNELITGSSFISGEMKSTDRKEHYKEINLADNAVMIATYGTTSTGISINRIFNLVLVEPGKSFVRVIQSIGRGLRKADDKEAVDVFDISSTCKFSKRHLTKRVQHYKKVQYPYVLNKVTY